MSAGIFADLRTVDEILLDSELAGDDGYLINGLVSTSVTTLLGAPFVGKTFSAVDIAHSLTTGEPWLGREVIREVDRVAFLCTDPGVHTVISKRVHQRGCDGRRILAMPFYAPGTFGEWKDAAKDLASRGVGLVIVDNTTDLAADTNAPREVKLITDGLRYWADHGAVVLNLHHKNGQGSTFGSILFDKWTRLRLDLKGRSGQSARTVETLSNDDAPESLAVTFNPRASGTPYMTIREAASKLQGDELSDQRNAIRQAESDRKAQEVAALIRSGETASNAAKQVRMSKQRALGIAKAVHEGRWIFPDAA